jgi:hypothetical protein
MLDAQTHNNQTHPETSKSKREKEDLLILLNTKRTARTVTLMFPRDYDKKVQKKRENLGVPRQLPQSLFSTVPGVFPTSVS